MPQTTTPLADETASDLAARTLGDASLFREILGLNASFNIDPFIPVIQSGGDAEILVPLKTELASRVQPALTSIKSGLESALRTTQSVIDRTKQYAEIGDSLGLNLSSEINGILGPVENGVLKSQEAVNEYGSSVKLVDWLLG